LNLAENIRMALYSLKSNFLRTALTLLIIAVGITCLVGILTAIDSILLTMSDSFNRLGAIDENYLKVSNYKLEEGRNFTFLEANEGSQKAIIGMDIVKELFDEKPERAMNKIIQINAARYKVIGILEAKGSTFGESQDRRIFITLTKAKQLYGYATKGYALNVSVKDAVKIDDAKMAAIGPMRNIRKLKASEENDFEIRTSDSIMSTLNENTQVLQIGSITIAMITLLGASIGLMNIMLVSVTERRQCAKYIDGSLDWFCGMDF